ncbi:MAG: hypothetical protein ACRERV_05445 [Methylococcales bacterium]
MIEFLKDMPPDLPVLTSGYESGFENFYRPEIVNIKHEPENPYFEGEFQVADENNTDAFRAVILQRVLRTD